MSYVLGSFHKFKGPGGILRLYNGGWKVLYTYTKITKVMTPGFGDPVYTEDSMRFGKTGLSQCETAVLVGKWGLKMVSHL